MSEIFVDADGCPVKQEIYRVAKRHMLRVILVSNSLLRLPQGDWVRQVVAGGNLDAADDWIAEHVAENDIVISGDIALASRCLAKGAVVVDPRGGTFTEGNIGDALGMAGLFSHLRGAGTITGGPAPFEKRHRSLFLQRLEEAIQAARGKK
ncbi:MAG: YaiI/YqxD family protein [Planctomycetota bacterium]